MQNNEFEKQVQERMGQIKFTPSEAVWAEVEKSLKQRRKRRIAIVWLFVFFIAAGGSSLAWFYFSPGNSGIANHDSSSTKKNATEIPSVANTPDQATISTPDKKVNSESDNLNEKSSSKNNADVKTKVTGQVAGTTPGISQKNTVSGSTSPKQKNKSVSPGSSLTVETSGSTIKKSKGKKSTVAVLATGSAIVASENSDKLNVKDEVAQDVAVKNNTSISDSTVTQKDSAVGLVKTAIVDSTATTPSTVKINTKAKSKWLFGYTIGAGMSDIVNPVSGAKSMDAAYAPPPSSNLSAPGSAAQNPGLPGSGVFIYPSELNPGFSFSIGAEATKKIKKRMSLNVGLQYHYYSTSIVVGRRLDSAFQRNYSSFLAGGPRENNHRNTYHFVELPVTLGFQLLKNKPLQLNTGLSIGYLFASDVLIYNKSQSIYYSGKDKLNRTQLNLLLGLSWTFAQNSKLPIQVGPSLSYGASNVSSKSDYGSNHMFSIGGSAKIMFRKK
jgi:hypothetical protein